MGGRHRRRTRRARPRARLRRRVHVVGEIVLHLHPRPPAPPRAPGEEHEERHDAHVEEEEQLGDAREGERARGSRHERLGSIDPERGGGGEGRWWSREGDGDETGHATVAGATGGSTRVAGSPPPPDPPPLEPRGASGVRLARTQPPRWERTDGSSTVTDAAARRRLARASSRKRNSQRARALREGHPPAAALDRGLSRGGRRRSERELDEEAGRGRAGAAVDRARVVLGGWRGDAEEDRDVRRAQARDGDGGHAARRGRV